MCGSVQRLICNVVYVTQKRVTLLMLSQHLQSHSPTHSLTHSLTHRLALRRSARASARLLPLTDGTMYGMAYHARLLLPASSHRHTR